MEIKMEKTLKVEPYQSGDYYIQPTAKLIFKVGSDVWDEQHRTGEWIVTTGDWKERINQFFAEVEEEIKQYKELYEDIQGFAIRIGAKIEHTSDC